VWWKLHDPNFNRFWLIHPCDRQTDRRTDGIAIAYARLQHMLSRAKNWTTLDPYCQRKKSRPLTTVSGDIRFMRIFAGVLWRGGIKRQWVDRKRRFSGILDATRLRHLRKWGRHYYIILFSPLSSFQWPQHIWPWVILTGYLALNSVLAPVWMTETARLRIIIAWKLIKIDTYCQRCKSAAGTLDSGNVRFVLIFGRVL